MRPTPVSAAGLIVGGVWREVAWERMEAPWCELGYAAAAAAAAATAAAMLALLLLLLLLLLWWWWGWWWWWCWWCCCWWCCCWWCAAPWFAGEETVETELFEGAVVTASKEKKNWTEIKETRNDLNGCKTGNENMMCMVVRYRKLKRVTILLKR